MTAIDVNALTQGIPATKTLCIVTDDDVLLEQDLDQAEAEQMLAYYIGHGEDCFIGNTVDYI